MNEYYATIPTIDEITMSKKNTANDTQLAFTVLPVGVLQCNCTIVADKSSKKAMVFDPGGAVDQILKVVKEMGAEEIVGIYCTHGHADHIMGVGDLKEKTGATVYLCEMDLKLWDDIEGQCNKFGLPCNHKNLQPDVFLQEGDETCIGNGKVIHTPGHSPGSISFHFAKENVVIVGDVLFRHSIGRTDLWGGDSSTLFKSIREKIYTLDQKTTVVTGHGPATTVGDELNGNPFV